MKKLILSSLFLGQMLTAFSQGESFRISFPDSVRIVLENTKNLDAKVVGTSLVDVWTKLDLTQQQQVQRQAATMKLKGYKARPHFVAYYGAIVDAVNVEAMDPRKLTEFLNVSGRVIDQLDAQKSFEFFHNSRTFFGRHALHFEKAYRLYAQEADYSFDFVGLPEPQPLVDTSSISESDALSEEEQPADETVLEPWIEPAPDTNQVYQPYWMQTPPPPAIDGPVIKFEKLTLNFVTKYDSAFIKNTKGTYSLTNHLFVGEGGTFDWSAALLPPDSVYCNFSEYSFDTRKAEVKSDLVKFVYIGKTPGTIYGKFEFRSIPRADSTASAYPKFTSYESNLAIQNVGPPHMQFRGGFSLWGNKISSASVLNDYGVIEVSSDSTGRLFTARSKEFVFKDSTVTAEKTIVTLYQRNDSIAHPQVRFKYDFGKEHVLLFSDKGTMRHTPYSSSFFNVDFDAARLQWDLKSDSMNILTDGGRDDVPMIIESVDYYDPEDYRLMAGEGFSFHALGLFVSYALQTGYNEFSTSDIAQKRKKDINEVMKAAEFLSTKGLLDYKPNFDRVTLKPKAYTIYKARDGKTDYDNVKILSYSPLYPNASLNIPGGYMTVRGVDVFKVSDSLNTVIKPDSSIIVMLQNRDIKFNGTIIAGNFEISGKEFTLKYDSFFISLNKIDSINFFITEKNARGLNVRRKVNNSMVGADSTAAAAGGLGNIAKSSGTLYINMPNNKSGKRKIPNYPRLDATTGGVIYFDRKEVLNGAYDRSVFFVVPPFKLDSLNDADPAAINFEGTFVSSGIFPSFKEKLHTMPDKSLGFEHKVPKEGWQLYKGDAKANGIITLDNRGLRGIGSINYLAATVHSPDFIYYPDSVIARGPRATLSEKQFGSVIFPDASVSDFQMKWYPKKDQMRLRNLSTPFNFYDSTAQLTGYVVVSKSGVKGSGKLDTRGTELISKEMNFTATDFGARHAEFKALSEDPNKPLMDGKDIRLKFNLKENYADLSPEVEGEAALDFPYAQFKTSIPNARWDLNQKKIVMSKSPDVPIENSYFYTTRKDLDSLRFNAEKAEYDLVKQELKVSGIPYIIVADAKITPENNEVLILENAKIGTLKNTTIIVDTLNGYHRLTEGVVDVVSRNQFSGYATYQYVNLLSDTFAIKMTDFHLEPIEKIDSTKRTSRRKQSVASQQTVANGSVTEKDKVVLGAGMFYKGDMIMYATRPALELNGYVKLDIKNIKNYNTWIQYKQTGDETDVSIDFDNAVTEESKKVDAGLHFRAADHELYISFLNEKADEDEDFFVPSGQLFYDKETKEYKIEDREKAAGQKLSGKVFAYNDETMQVRFEGPVNLFYGTNDFNVQATTIGRGNLQNDEISMNTFIMISPNIVPAAFDIMARTIQEVIKNEGADEGLGDKTELLYKIADIVGERVAKSYEEKSSQGYVSLGTIGETAKPLTFADVNLKWSPKQKAFYSEGKLGLSNIGRNDINGAFEGFIEIKKNEDGGAVFNLFIKASPEVWYYFGFEDNRLLCYSSNQDFNTTISKKTNSGKAKAGEMVFAPGSEDETLSFINRFRKEYYGIEVPYNLSAGTGGTRKKTTEEEKKEDDGF